MSVQVVSLLEDINKRLAAIAQTLAALPPDAINPQQAYTRTQAARVGRSAFIKFSTEGNQT
jgi:hypothetical protein